MDDKIQQELGNILEYLRKGIEAGGSFAAEQAPAVVYEAIWYGRAYETVFFLIGAALLANGLWHQRSWGGIDFDALGEDGYTRRNRYEKDAVAERLRAKTRSIVRLVQTIASSIMGR